MPLSIDLTQLPPIARKILSSGATDRPKKMAADGVVLGAPPHVIVTVVAALVEDEDAEIRAHAEKTLRGMTEQILGAAMAKPLDPAVIELVAKLRHNDPWVLTLVAQHPDASFATLEEVARSAPEEVTERIAVNEQRLLAHPQLIEALYLNDHTRSSTADRVVELAIRNGVELGIPAFAQIKAAMSNELIAEPSEEPSPDDLLFKQVAALAEQVAVDPENEDTHVVDEEGKEEVDEKCKPLWVQLTSMTPAQKIRRAILGTSTERLLLVRDSNRVVAEAAIRSPRLKENEVVKISSSRAVSVEVLRVISKNREWLRSHQIKYNLVTNPRTPFARALPLMAHLRDHELRAIAKSKNVPSNVAAAARQQLIRRKK